MMITLLLVANLVFAQLVEESNTAPDTPIIPKVTEDAPQADSDGKTSEEKARLAVMNNKQAEMVRYSGVMQFSEGSVERVGLKNKMTFVTHGSPIYENERLKTTDKDTYFKLISRNRCIGAIYGASSVTSPAFDQPWRIHTDSLRWICPPGSTELIKYKGHSLQLNGGEILIHEKMLTVLKGTVVVNGKELPEKTLFSFNKNGIKKAEPPKNQKDPDFFFGDEYFVWKFNKSIKIPQESYPFPEPNKPTYSRLIFNVGQGMTNMYFDNTALNQGNMVNKSGRVEMHINWGGWDGWDSILSIGYREIVPKEVAPTGGRLDINNRLKMFVIDGGARLSHANWWSPYYRFGIGAGTLEVNTSNSSGFLESTNSIYMFLASVGLDAQYSVTKWFGLYGGLEFQFGQSLGFGEKKRVADTFTDPKPTIASEPWRVTSLGLGWSVGVKFEF